MADSDSEKHGSHLGPTLSARDVDTAAQLVSGTRLALDENASLALRQKIDRRLMPLMCLLYMMTFADKTTLGQSAVLGLIQGVHLTQNQFNWLGTIFYLAFLVFQYPQNLALQRFPVGKWISVNIFIWAIALLCHAACKSFGGLFAARFVLGAAEGAITPGFILVTSMFYTREEQTRRVGYWYLMNGFAIILLGLISFGLLHITHPTFMPWQWLMTITGIITLFTSVLFWFFFPDSPTNASFLTHEERIMAVQRIKSNQTGVESKRWKRSQFIETFTDPKTYLLALLAAICNLVNSLTNQRQLIVNQFGFNVKTTTLLGCVDGAVEILTIYIIVSLSRHSSIGRAYSAVLSFVPAILGSILVITLPSGNKVGLLLSYYVAIFVFPPFAILLAWVASITSGHTKKITTNAVVLSSYAIGNAVGPFMWQKKYQPRNRVPWAVITAASFVSASLILLLRSHLAKENRRRDNAVRDESYDDVHISVPGKNGIDVEQKVDKAFLDLTDRENLDFRYVL